MRCGDRTMSKCLESDLCNSHLISCSPRVLKLLKQFFTVQRELSLALLEAKPLGTCKITTSINPTTGGVSTSISALKETL